MADQKVQNLIEAIDKVKEKRANLSYQIDNVQELRRQVDGSQEKALEFLHSTFKKICSQIQDVLKKRESELENEVKETANKDRCALSEVEGELQGLLETSINLMGEGKKLLMSNHDDNLDNMTTFVKQVESTELESETIIPPPQEVVCIHVDLPAGLEKEVETSVEDYGTVFGRAPVQITEVLERPGAVLVQWGETEDDQCLDLKEFRLQYCCSAVSYETQGKADFSDMYKGELTKYLLCNLRKGQSYSLRVCGRAAGAKVWSPWSVPLVTSTTLRHYEWSTCSDYTLTNDHTVCEKTSDADHQVIVSEGPSLHHGHAIRFKLLEESAVTPGDGLFITPVCSTQRVPTDQQQAILLTTEGKIFVDGEEKLTRFPALHRKSSVTFDTETLSTNKLTVNIEVNDKKVAFDWTLKSPDPGGAAAGACLPGMLGNNQEKTDCLLYFGAQFTSNGWKVAVK